MRGRGAEPHMFRISDLVFGILQLNNYDKIFNPLHNPTYSIQT